MDLQIELDNFLPRCVLKLLVPPSRDDAVANMFDRHVLCMP